MSTSDFELPLGLELDQIVTLQEAIRISSMSRDTWKRHHWDKVVELSPRRLGVRLRDALMIRQSRRRARGPRNKMKTAGLRGRRSPAGFI